MTLLAKKAAIKGAELKEQLTNEAKRLGTKAWKKAIKMAEAYKNKIDNSTFALKSKQVEAIVKKNEDLDVIIATLRSTTANLLGFRCES